MCHTEPTNERAERLSSLRLSRARRRKAKPNHGKHRKVRLWRMLGSRTDFGRSARKTQRSPNIPKPVRASISVARRHSCVPHNPARGCTTGIPMCSQTVCPLFTCKITCELYTNYALRFRCSVKIFLMPCPTVPITISAMKSFFIDNLFVFFLRFDLNCPLRLQ